MKTEIIKEFNLSSNYRSIKVGKTLEDGYKRDFKPLHETYNIKVNNDVFEYNTSIADLGKKISKIHHEFKECNSAYMVDGELYIDIGNSRKLADTYGMLYGVLTINKLNKKLKNDMLSEDDLLFAFRCILSDALYFIDYRIDDFINEFGYTDSLESIRKGETIYRECEDTYRKLNLSETRINELLEQLSDEGVE